MLANVLMPIYEAGIEGRMLADQQFTAAVMTRQSIEQRNAEWAAEFTLFSSFVRPMMTFMEGFVFALGPVMAFLITLGGLGIKVAGKYFLTLLWIQLWMPTAAIVNLFLVMTVERTLPDPRTGF
jgi:conjugal transfer mating pair stabilization protein TraG